MKNSIVVNGFGRYGGKYSNGGDSGVLFLLAGNDEHGKFDVLLV